MPDETMPRTSASPAATDAESGTGSGASTGARIALGCGGVALVALLALLVPLVWHAAGSTDFPRVAPEEMAERALQRSEEAYEVMGFTRTIPPGVEDIGVSTENTYGSSPCYDGGLLGLEDKTIDGAYSMHHSWALDRVPASQAVPGLKRLHQRLKDDGWEITSYREGTKSVNGDLFVQRDDGAERMSFTWYADREYFTGGASVPCAYDPAWKTGDVGTGGENLWPPAFGPARGR